MFKKYRELKERVSRLESRVDHGNVLVGYAYEEKIYLPLEQVIPELIEEAGLKLVHNDKLEFKLIRKDEEIRDCDVWAVVSEASRLRSNSGLAKKAKDLMQRRQRELARKLPQTKNI